MMPAAARPVWAEALFECLEVATTAFELDWAKNDLNMLVKTAHDRRQNFSDAQAEAILGCPLPGATAHIVRDVSPHKLMMCVSFVLPDAVCWADGDEGVAASAASGSDSKRQRSE